MTYLRTMVSMLLCVALAMTAVSAAAHGSGQHIMGTVTALSDTRIDVKTQKGENLTVHLSDKTEFRPRGKETTGTRPQIGDRVVIEATGSDENLTATEILFATAPGKTKAGRP